MLYKPRKKALFCLLLAPLLAGGDVAAAPPELSLDVQEVSEEVARQVNATAGDFLREAARAAAPQPPAPPRPGLDAQQLPPGADAPDTSPPGSASPGAAAPAAIPAPAGPRPAAGNAAAASAPPAAPPAMPALGQGPLRMEPEEVERAPRTEPAPGSETLRQRYWGMEPLPRGRAGAGPDGAAKAGAWADGAGGNEMRQRGSESGGVHPAEQRAMHEPAGQRTGASSLPPGRGRASEQPLPQDRGGGKGERGGQDREREDEDEHEHERRDGAEKRRR
ncbi:MAG: hypothetical protein FJ125_04555 [Deltaproteobacteria bacterium]|nr:hypothetical protein [Deltaproteobacteria bacterium]